MQNYFPQNYFFPTIPARSGQNLKKQGWLPWALLLVVPGARGNNTWLLPRQHCSSSARHYWRC